MKRQLDRHGTLEEDLEQIKKGDLPFEMAMIVTYRSEKKKIVAS
jgi:hypothetical protein